LARGAGFFLTPFNEALRFMGPEIKIKGIDGVDVSQLFVGGFGWSELEAKRPYTQKGSWNASRDNVSC